MADTIELELITKSDLDDYKKYYESNPLMLALLNEKKQMGKDIGIIHAKASLDTSTANTPTESTAPTNEVLNFATPQQIYIRSSSALDLSLTVAVIGQESDGSFGQFILTSHATLGTTPVDCGTWNFIMYPIKLEAWAGNLILDDDGASTTVFWTLALGVSGSDGIIIIPDGYVGCKLDEYLGLIVVPTTIATDIMGAQINSGELLTATFYEMKQFGKFMTEIYAEQTRIAMKTKFKTAVVASIYDLNLLIWEV